MSAQRSAARRDSLARDRTDAEQRLRGLTGRELEVLALVATGATSQAIAERLQIKPATVKAHLQNVYVKLGAGNRVQATHCYLLARPPAAAMPEIPRADPSSPMDPLA